MLPEGIREVLLQPPEEALAAGLEPDALAAITEARCAKEVLNLRALAWNSQARDRRHDRVYHHAWHLLILSCLYWVEPGALGTIARARLWAVTPLGMKGYKGVKL